MRQLHSASLFAPVGNRRNEHMFDEDFPTSLGSAHLCQDTIMFSTQQGPKNRQCVLPSKVLGGPGDMADFSIAVMRPATAVVTFLNSAMALCRSLLPVIVLCSKWSKRARISRCSSRACDPACCRRCPQSRRCSADRFSLCCSCAGCLGVCAMSRTSGSRKRFPHVCSACFSLVFSFFNLRPHEVEKLVLPRRVMRCSRCSSLIRSCEPGPKSNSRVQSSVLGGSSDEMSLPVGSGKRLLFLQSLRSSDGSRLQNVNVCEQLALKAR